MLHFCHGLPIILVACKKDLRDDPKTIQDLARMNQRPVSRQEGLAVAQKIGAQGYVECSAKSGDGVREVFQTATRAALTVSSLTCARTDSRPRSPSRRAAARASASCSRGSSVGFSHKSSQSFCNPTFPRLHDASFNGPTLDDTLGSSRGILLPHELHIPMSFGARPAR